MNDRYQNLGALATAVALSLLVPLSVAGQTPQTPWGDPDLQGVYTFSTPTPMERPEELGNKATYTEAELAEVEAEFEAREAVRWAGEGAVEGAPDDGYDRTVWFPGEKGEFSHRTSLVVDPPNGRIPPLTPEAQLSLAEREAEREADLEARSVPRVVDGFVVADTAYISWTNFSLRDRCAATSIPRIGGVYNHGVQIVQTPRHVVVYYENLHSARIIPLDSRPAPDADIQQWNGISRGHWEGDTLVVHSTNFTDKTTFEGIPMGNMKLVERFTRVDENTIDYAVTVNDPAWTEPWTMILPFRGNDELYQDPEDLFEYACHEGNFRMMSLALKAGRAMMEQDKD